ncbi:MAG: hypothetical protein AAB088_00065, partial [Actinomycetota bacterium]
MYQSYEVSYPATRQVWHDSRTAAGACLFYVATRWSWILVRVVPFLSHRIFSLIIAASLTSIAISLHGTRVWVVACALVLVLIGASGGQDAWRRVTTPSLGLYRGPAIIRSDPQRFHGGQRVTLELGGNDPAIVLKD